MDDSAGYPRRRIYLDGKPQRDEALKALAKVWPDHPPLFFGVSFENTLKSFIRNNEPFIYVDHAYFKRGYQFGNFRVCYKNLHHTTWVERPDDRRLMWCKEFHPWRKEGSHIVVVPPTDSWDRVVGFQKQWGNRMCETIAKYSKRPIIHLTKKGGFSDAMRKAHAVVVHCSVAGLEAAVSGVPVFCEDLCPASPVGLRPTELHRIEDPWLPTDEERKKWLNSICYATWNIKEFHKIPGAYAQYLGSH